jgi:hypothetical protein
MLDRLPSWQPGEHDHSGDLISSGGFSLIDPGVVFLPLNATNSPADPSQFWGLAGVGQTT